MAKDDYFTIVAKMLRYLYRCLKDGMDPDPGMLTAESLGIVERYWLYIMVHMIDGGYIEGVEYRRYLSEADVTVIHLEKAQITPEGIEYLLDNRMIKKVVETLKTVREITG